MGQPILSPGKNWLGQVWYLNVSIPDLWLPLYFISTNIYKIMYGEVKKKHPQDYVKYTFLANL